MKIRHGILVAFLFTTGHFAMAQASPTEVPAPIERIFIPSGFDDNDNVEVILQGTFPNTCYRVGHAGAKMDENSREIKVWATSYRYDGICAQVLTPFIQVVKLGILPKGDYRVVLENDNSIERVMNIKQSTTESADDYMYAPVENAALEVDASTGRQQLLLRGHYPLMLHGCAVITEIRQTIEEDMVVVQPIMTIYDDQSICEKEPLEFKKVEGLVQPFHGKGLLHVRVLNGNSLNRFIDVQ